MKKYRRKYRIPIPTPNTDTDPALAYGRRISNIRSTPLLLTRYQRHERHVMQAKMRITTEKNNIDATEKLD